MRVKITRLAGLLFCAGLVLFTASPLWAGSVTYDYDDFGRLIEALYDDGTQITYTYDDAGNRLTQVITVPPSGDVIVDDLDANTSQTGTWKVSTDPSSFAGQSLFATKAATFRWLPTLPQQSTYAVYAWWVFHNKNSSAVPYEISHAGGTTIVNVNQHDSALAGQWNLLGSFSFNAGSGAWVEVSRPGGRVYADAVRFVLAGPPAASADLSVSMTDSPDPIDVGNNITYTAMVTNNGPDGATGVTLTDNLPASLSLVSAIPSQGSCGGDPNITCSLGSLANAASATVTIVATANSAGTVDNTANVSATENDPQGSNDSFTASTTVDPVPGGDIIVDDQDAGGTQIGSWNVSSDTASFAGQSLWSKKANARFEWHFTIPTTGSYQVFAWWVDRAQITTSAPYTIHHAGGSTTVTVDQSPAALEGQWNLLGTFTFNAGSLHFVEIDTTNGQVSADAVKLVAQ